MNLQLIRIYLATREGKVIAITMALSVMIWAGATAANAAIDLGAAIHDATCPDHAAHRS